VCDPWKLLCWIRSLGSLTEDESQTW
jgi:hypothetical protein